jgi:hypothetical protein
MGETELIDAIQLGISGVASLRSLPPLPSGHHEKQEPDPGDEPIDAGRGIAARIARGPGDEYDENAHDREPGDPSQRERRPTPASPRTVEDKDDGDDRDGAERNGHRSRQQLANSVLSTAGFSQLRHSREEITN